MNDKNALNDGDEDSNTALHLAALGGHIRLVETLLDLGAGPEIRLTIMIIVMQVFYYELKSVTQDSSLNNNHVCIC